MNKQKAIEMLGGSITAAADAIGISYQAVNKWPDELPPRIADRVYAALARKNDQPSASTAQAATENIANADDHRSVSRRATADSPYSHTDIDRRDEVPGRRESNGHAAKPTEQGA